MVVLKGTLNLPCSTKFYWQDTWMNEGIENCYSMYIIASSFETKLTRKSQVVIIQIWKPKRVSKTSKEEFKKLANALVDGNSGGSFSISLATFGALGFPFLVVG
jgi:hypothetical protein